MHIRPWVSPCPSGRELEHIKSQLGLRVPTGELPTPALMPDQNVDIFPCLSDLMYRVWKAQGDYAERVRSGAYRWKSIESEVHKGVIQRCVHLGTQNVLDIDIRSRAKLACDTLFDKAQSLEWNVPANGPLAKHLEDCKLRVGAAEQVVTQVMVPSSIPRNHTDDRGGGM